MSFNRLNYDNCTYEQDLRASVDMGSYFLRQPKMNCKSCIPLDPALNPSQSHIGPIQDGIDGSTCEYIPNIDVSSKLLNLNAPSSRCPSKNRSVDSICKLNKKNICNKNPVRTEDTRISNPPCTLRGTGWNRWEWLCNDPQKKALTPFEHDVSYRIVVKDNHRPRIPKPINQAASLPPLNSSCEVYQSPWMNYMPCNEKTKGTPPALPSVQWRKCSTYKKLQSNPYAHIDNDN